jgi:iron complex outermembrane receptor protein
VDSVEGAARHSQRLTEAPASVTIVTANDIETFGWRTLADVLKSVRGFHVTYDRNYSYLGVRAFGRPTDYNNRSW